MRYKRNNNPTFVKYTFTFIPTLQIVLLSQMARVVVICNIFVFLSLDVIAIEVIETKKGMIVTGIDRKLEIAYVFLLCIFRV